MIVAVKLDLCCIFYILYILKNIADNVHNSLNNSLNICWKKLQVIFNGPPCVDFIFGFPHKNPKNFDDPTKCIPAPYHALTMTGPGQVTRSVKPSNDQLIFDISIFNPCKNIHESISLTNRYAVASLSFL